MLTILDLEPKYILSTNKAYFWHNNSKSIQRLVNDGLPSL